MSSLPDTRLTEDAANTAFASDARPVIIAGIMLAAVVATGLVLVVARRFGSGRKRHDSNSTLVRSWLAIVLVTGLLICCGWAFTIEDSSLRSTLVGALAASVGSVVAFYFASKSSDQARQDILNATFGTDTVPDLEGKAEEAATAIMGLTSFRLAVDPTASPASATATVKTQFPAKNSLAPKGSTVTVWFYPPKPPPGQ